MSLAEQLKEHYRTKFIGWSDQIWPLNEELAKVILSYQPKSVFEFAAGCGKHTKLLFPHIESYLGVDVDPRAIKKAGQLGRRVILGDESKLGEIAQYDIVFTCSALTHVPDIGGIIPELKRIATKAVILAETQDKPFKTDSGKPELDTEAEWRYHPHDYESMGFRKLDYVWDSFHRLQKYHIWVWEK